MNKLISPQRECPDCGYDLEPGLRDSLECRKCGYSGNPISPEQREEIRSALDRPEGFSLYWFIDFKNEKLLQNAPEWLRLQDAEITRLQASEQAWKEEAERIQEENEKLKLIFSPANKSWKRKVDVLETQLNQAAEELEKIKNEANDIIQLGTSAIDSEKLAQNVPNEYFHRGRVAGARHLYAWVSQALSSLSQKEE